MTKLIIGILLLIFFVLVGTASAQSYSYTFIKDGKTYVETKTTSSDLTIIEIKVYDTNGKLIDTQVFEKPLLPTSSVSPKPLLSPAPARSPKPLLPAATPIVKPLLPPTQIRSKLPLDFNAETGNLMVNNKVLQTEPQDVLDNAKSLGLDQVETLSVVEREGELKYLVEGVRNEKLLAIIKVVLPTSYVYNTQTGQLEKTEQSPLVKVLDALSF